MCYVKRQRQQLGMIARESVVHGRGHAIRAVHARHSTEFPQRILQAFAQAGEAPD